jgi:hypothetical protein
MCSYFKKAGMLGDILPEIGIIFFVLALFGFILHDAFNSGFSPKPHNLYHSYVLTIFHYVSIALFVLSFSVSLFIMILAAPNQNNAITQFFNMIFQTIQNFENQHLLDAGFTKTVTNDLILSFFPAFFYFVVISIVMFSGNLTRFLNKIWVKVWLSDTEFKEFPKIISDDDNFFYFVHPENVTFWTAIRKSDIKQIEVVEHKSKLADKWEVYKKHLEKLNKEGGKRAILIEIFVDFGLYIMWAIFFIIAIIFSGHV